MRVLPPARVTYPGQNFTSSDTFLPADNSLPDLSQFVTGDSFLIFNIMRITDDELTDWLSLSADEWVSDKNSPAFCRGFAENTHFENNAAERFTF